MSGMENHGPTECAMRSVACGSPTPRAGAGASAPEFYLRVTGDRMAVMLDCCLDGHDLDWLAACLATELKELGILELIAVDDLKQRLTPALEGERRLENFRLIEGKPAVPTQHGRIEWAQDFFNDNFAVDEKTGTINYRLRMAQRSVTENQLLARVVPPRAGEEGRDVFGKRLAVEKPKKIRAVEGRNVRVEMEGEDFLYFATTAGRIQWDNPKISVNKVFEIRGNVGLATGDISHPGTVIIAGDVLNGASVQADDDIEIEGSIEDATIRTGGNLVIRGGIMGGRHCRIAVKGDLHARFIHNARVEAGGAVIVANEIVHSELVTRGRVQTPNGRLVGGSISALRGIVARQAGSEAHARTCLCAGFDEDLFAEIRRCEQELETHRENWEKASRKIELCASRQAQMSRPERELLAQLTDNARKIDLAIGELTEELDRLRATHRSNCKARILIRERLFQETFIHQGEVTVYIGESIPGPLAVVFRDDKAEVRKIDWVES